MNIQHPTFWGFFHSPCIFESAAALRSLHATKALAWRAMHAELWNFWEEEQRPRETNLHLPPGMYRHSRRQAPEALSNQLFRIQAVQVQGFGAVLEQLAGAVHRTDAMVVASEVDNDNERIDHHRDVRRLARYHARRRAANELNRELRSVYKALTGRDPWADIPL